MVSSRRSWAVVFVILLTAAPSLASGTDAPEERREYLGGGSFSGTTTACTPSLPFDFLAACDIPCPGSTCTVRVIDDVWRSDIGFRVCFDGETFCRPEVYVGYANIPGWHSRITIVPQLARATHGVAIVT